MPKPWTSDTFVNMIARLLRIADWLHKICVTNAIILVHTVEGLSDPVVLQVCIVHNLYVIISLKIFVIHKHLFYAINFGYLKRKMYLIHLYVTFSNS